MATSSRKTGVRRSRKSEAGVSLERLCSLKPLTQFDSDRDIGQLLEHWADSDTRVVRSSTRNKEKSSTSSDHRQVRLQTTEGDGVGVEVDTTTHSVDDRLWLFVDFLLHEVVILTLHNLGKLNFKRLDGSDRRDGIVTAESVNV